MSMLVDGKTIATAILADVKSDIGKFGRPLRLAVFACAPNFETRKFLALKQRRAAEVGVIVSVIEFDATVTVATVQAAIASAHTTADGIVVQLPFPLHFPIDTILEQISSSHDVDVLRYDGTNAEILPPVVGAIDAITEQYHIHFDGKSVVIMGNGRLVGMPATTYVKAHGAPAMVLEKHTPGASHYIKNADILILGTGVPHVVTGSMVKTGVVVFDAGASEVGGQLVGDAAPDVAEKASLITPVPGGIGPITVAILLRNLIRLRR